MAKSVLGKGGNKFILREKGAMIHWVFGKLVVKLKEKWAQYLITWATFVSKTPFHPLGNCTILFPQNLIF